MAKKKNISIFLIITTLFIGLSVIVWNHTILRPNLLFKRMELVILFYLFCSLHCFLDIKKMYEWLHKYRYVIFIALFAFSVLNCFNGSSLGMFDNYFQTGKGSDFVSPVLGKARAIRSDEWMVNVPRLISAAYSNYGQYNSLVRATTSTNLVASGGLMLDYAALRDPSSWGYYLFGSSFGLSYQWSYRFIFGFAIWYELFLILTNNKKLLSLFGTALVWFSTFNLWWSIVTQLITGPAIVVLFYYFLKEDNKVKRLIIGSGLAIAGSDFACNLYPAWQVPMGYIVLSMMVWELIENQKWKKYDWKDWVVFGIDVLFMLSIIARFIIVDMEYIDGISKTIYPGARVEYGGFSLTKLLGYLYVTLAFIVPQTNPCEMSCIAIVFPLGLLLDLYVLHKSKYKNKLLICLSFPMLLLLAYCSVGLPPILAKVTLMTYSTPERAVDYLGVVLAIIMIVSLCELEKIGKFKLFHAFVLSLITIIPSFLYCYKLDDHMIVKIVMFIETIIMIIILTNIIGDTKFPNKNMGKVLATMCLITTGILVNPIMVGTDAIFSKPAAKEIIKIVKEDKGARWVGLNSIVAPQYLLACGATTINSINYIPNYELWKKLDPENKYEKIWNRYAHMVIELGTEESSSYDLLSPDSIKLTLSKSDFEKLNVSYVMTQNEIPDSWTDLLSQIYKEDGVWIYKMK